VGFGACLDALEKGEAFSRFSRRGLVAALTATSPQERKKKKHKGLRIEQREV
jgi:hypothetical protein